MDCTVCLRADLASYASQQDQSNDYLAEIFLRTIFKRRDFYAGLSLMVWILKREVRAFGGCLGMYRR